MAQNSSTSATKRRRGPGRPFAAGVSGNPAGRPKVAQEIRELAQHYGEKVIKRLIAIALDTKSEPQVAIAAARVVLDRGYGRPIQEVEITNPNDQRSARDMTDDELAAILREETSTNHTEH